MSTWVMITPQTTGLGWVQAGRIRWYNHCTVIFSQSYDGVSGDIAQTTMGSTCQADSGGTNTFADKWVGTCSCIQATENGALLQSSNFDPHNFWATPWGPEFLGEAAYLQNDMPGNSASPTTFSNLQRQTSGGSFSDYACSVLESVNDTSNVRADGEKWFNVTSSCPGFNIYTDTSS